MRKEVTKLPEHTFTGSNSTFCSPPYDDLSRGFSVYAAIVAFIIPFTLLIVFYVAIAAKLRAKQATKIKRIRTKVSTVWLSSTDTHNPRLLAPPGSSRRNTAVSVTLTDIEDAASSGAASAHARSGSVYLGQGGEVTRVARRQLRREEAVQRRSATSRYSTSLKSLRLRKLLD